MGICLAGFTYGRSVDPAWFVDLQTSGVVRKTQREITPNGEVEKKGIPDHSGMPFF
jgi:hypothetical protein